MATNPRSPGDHSHSSFLESLRLAPPSWLGHLRIPAISLLIYFVVGTGLCIYDVVLEHHSRNIDTSPLIGLYAPPWVPPPPKCGSREEIPSPDNQYTAVKLSDCSFLPPLGPTGLGIHGKYLEEVRVEQEGSLGLAESVSLGVFRGAEDRDLRTDSQLFVQWRDASTLIVSYDAVKPPYSGSNPSPRVPRDALVIQEGGPGKWKDIQIQYRDLRNPPLAVNAANLTDTAAAVHLYGGNRFQQQPDSIHGSALIDMEPGETRTIRALQSPFQFPRSMVVDVRNESGDVIFCATLDRNGLDQQGTPLAPGARLPEVSILTGQMDCAR